MTSPESSPRCPGCRACLTTKTRHASAWERSPYGDEYTDELHRCDQCDAWALATFVDRFSGPDEVKVSGPLSEEELQEQRDRLSSQS